MSIFGMTSVVGIALGPFLGGAIQTNHTTLNWHWIFWIQLIVDGALLPVFYFILKETRGDVILTRKAKKIRKESGRNIYCAAELEGTGLRERLKISFLRPTKMLATEFVVISFTLWVSFGECSWVIFHPFNSNSATLPGCSACISSPWRPVNHPFPPLSSFRRFISNVARTHS